jgi:hypothetical protein
MERLALSLDMRALPFFESHGRVVNRRPGAAAANGRIGTAKV